MTDVPEEPITLNHYAYAGSDPTNNGDPGGRDFSVAETVSVSGIENTLDVGLGYMTPQCRPTMRRRVSLI